MASTNRAQKPGFTSFVPVIVFLLLIAIAAYLNPRRSTPKPTSCPPKQPVSARPPREPGRWTTSDFKMPTPEAYPNWSIEHTRPLPYRPFRYGPKYHVTMGLRSVKHAEWIELDNEYPRYHATKALRIRERGPRCCKTAPEAYPAALELLQDLADYLPARYPSLYRRTPDGGVLHNLWSGERFDVAQHPLAEDPMQMCARLVQDDLAIMVERADGQYYLLAGAILLPGFWRLEDKFGMALSGIHTSGHVPQFRETLERGMANFFRRVKPEEMVARHNYFLQVDDNLAWSESIGSEDDAMVGWSTAEKDRAIEHHYFRSERQTLRRLPRSGGVVFTIRTYFLPITEIVKEDYVPGRLASAIRSWGDDVSRYKGRERYGDVLLDYLDQKHGQQVRRGAGFEPGGRNRLSPYQWRY
ncbi:uncharacterized protein B0T15DRAFT_567796 [Chaetomium strumarium]|uniref:Uncharacterized protein n=1 Tax=Chaetomium strumarium TaxID=1170767 RepID=A0AAJ0M1Z4_9PEZI|nr:hypothetical protein B0T15DRAFT_567796 [Chaetomium strumarium]